VALLRPAASRPLVPAEEWSGTELLLPREALGRRLRDVLDGGELSASGGRLPLARVLVRLPVALLEAA
jgi:(1->4)-alpha-D-glucan 1-alpha-D-glucosylmutase